MMSATAIVCPVALVLGLPINIMIVLRVAFVVTVMSLMLLCFCRSPDRPADLQSSHVTLTDLDEYQIFTVHMELPPETL
jgi:hypothetical protein